jgi:hypothetical protein
MKKLTWQEMEEQDSMADAWIEEEKIRQWEEALERASQNGSESL